VHYLQAAPRLTRQQRLAVRQERAAQAESRVRFDQAQNQLKMCNYRQALEDLQRVQSSFFRTTPHLSRTQPVAFRTLTRCPQDKRCFICFRAP
jgi:hypothetical protein